jgi:hypothetical protein
VFTNAVRFKGLRAYAAMSCFTARFRRIPQPLRISISADLLHSNKRGGKLGG